MHSRLRPVLLLLKILKRWFLTLILRMKAAIYRRLYKEILVVGDSHSMVFRHTSFRENFPMAYFHLVCVQGATASGLENPNSKTQAYPTFRKSIENYSGSTVVSLLGEVDTGFVIWFRAQKNQTPINKTLYDAVKTYCRFLDEIATTKEVICISTPLPTISDENDWGEIANLRKEITASQKERTKLTLEFNSLVAQHCSNSSINFISLDEHSLGEDALVNPELLHRDPSNHHYDDNAYAALICDALKNHLLVP